MSKSAPINFHEEAKSLVPHFLAVEQDMAASPDKKLFHLVALRASQINQCAYCVNMHINEALADGENQKRIDRLVVWRQVSDFSEREKAAFAWTEAITRLNPEQDFGILRQELRQHFNEREAAYLTAKVAMINLWNRIQVPNY